jgi:hypothetical protein
MKNIKEKGYEHYLVDTDGKVYNSKTMKELKSYPNKNTGYMTVVLRNAIKPRCVYVHRLVASAYLPNPFNLPEVNHKNFIRNDNKLSNLEWVNKKQNVQHRSNRFGKGSGGRLYNTIKNNKTLVDKGIEKYKMYGNLKSVTDVWYCSTTLARRILIENGVEIYKKNTIPMFIKNELLELCNSNPKLKHRHLVTYTKIKYGISLSRHITSSIISNKQSLFSITKEYKKNDYEDNDISKLLNKNSKDFLI